MTYLMCGDNFLESLEIGHMCGVNFCEFFRNFDICVVIIFVIFLETRHMCDDNLFESLEIWHLQKYSIAIHSTGRFT